MKKPMKKNQGVCTELKTKANVEGVLNYIKATAVERGGSDGVFNRDPVSFATKELIEKLIEIYKENMAPASARLYSFNENNSPHEGHKFLEDIVPKETLTKAAKELVSKISKSQEDLLIAKNILVSSSWGTRRPGSLQRADIITANHKENKKVGLYLRYVESTSICTAARDNSFDLGVFANPPDFKKIANDYSPNAILLYCGLRLRKEEKADPKLGLDKVIEKMYHLNDT